MSILQLGNCKRFLCVGSRCSADFSWAGYLLLGMLSSLVFRAARDALPDNPAAQERIIGASLFAMAVADVSTLGSIRHARLT